MSVTLEVLKLLRSREVKCSQPENIFSILVTFEVLKPLRSRVFNKAQPANISPMSVTELVFKYLIPVMETTGILRNQP